MKLESIDLRNFLSHEATHWELNGARLATIVGSNGAGKSALLDGFLFALYDAARARTDPRIRFRSADVALMNASASPWRRKAAVVKVAASRRSRASIVACVSRIESPVSGTHPPSGNWTASSRKLFPPERVVRPRFTR